MFDGGVNEEVASEMPSIYFPKQNWCFFLFLFFFFNYNIYIYIYDEENAKIDKNIYDFVEYILISKSYIYLIIYLIVQKYIEFWSVNIIRITII